MLCSILLLDSAEKTAKAAEAYRIVRPDIHQGDPES